MDPILIKLGPLEIRWYGLFLVLSFILAIEIGKRLVRSWGHNPEHFERASFWALIWGIVGARLMYVLTSPNEFAANPAEALAIWKGGISIHGGLLAGVVVYWYFSRRHGYPLAAYLDAAVPGVALGIVAGRLGNFMNGSDTVGRLTTLPIGFTWPTWATGFPGICKGISDISQVSRCAADALVRGPVHLTQIYGVLIGVALLLLSVYWLAQQRAFGYVAWQFVLWYSLLRAGLEEPFRLNPLWLEVYRNDTLGIGLFTATQLFSIPLVILAMVMLWRWRRPKWNHQEVIILKPTQSQARRKP